MTVQDNSPESVSFDSYRQLLSRYERLLEISRQLNSTLDLGTLLNLITGAATELTDTEEASILLIDPSSGELRFEAASNMTPGMMAAIPVPMSGSIGGWVATHGEILIVEDASQDSRWFGNVDKTIQFETRNLIAVPMKAHNRVIGVLEAVNRRDNQPWTKDHINTLVALANQAAIAIQNTRLFQQSDFIAEMVHELRTPLAALRASTALLLRPKLPDDRRQDIIVTMQEETERLTAMTTAFLDLARLESGRTRLEMEVFGIFRLIAECVEVVAPQASERGIQIEVIGENHETEADWNKIKQVMLNLLTNAIKYNRENGHIYCRVELCEDTGDCSPEHMLLSVQDTGYGISKEDQPHIFDKFYRVADMAGYTTGTGLGLSIAFRIVQAHGCEMTVTSEVDVGTTFSFTLPLAERAPEHPMPGSMELTPRE
ncbi:MAG: GAF domain-containing sensor histidine kinase [Chloroflexi bacterium]|nr:GAF domain-containing sensor histidine kinase [Chloroflexota bacterium]